MAFSSLYPVVWHDNHVLLIDQNRLPNEFALVDVKRCDDMIRAIESTIVRGAPAIGVAAAYGMYLGARDIKTSNREEFLQTLEAIAAQFQTACPSTVNLVWATERMLKSARQTIGPTEHLKHTLLRTALDMNAEGLKTCQDIGEHGLSVLPSSPQKLRILTHYNAGALATAGYGTALGVIRSAQQAQRLEQVYVGETRPRFQGSKLTAWECVQEGIPVTVIADNMVAHCMKREMVDAVVVGADRIAINGDTVNRIGTYSIAIIANAHHIPFFVAAPLSTIDFDLSEGNHIPIEEHDAAEIFQVGEKRMCPPEARCYNPVFDVTPANLITAIITERGAVSPTELQDLREKQVV
ncbi:MAG TPA: S-methyl-5-thioribose-1-phosphate isomerase [Elainellaceae cyanobacterium]